MIQRALEVENGVAHRLQGRDPGGPGADFLGADHEGEIGPVDQHPLALEGDVEVAGQGSEPVGNTPAEFKAFIESELVKWRRLVEISGATVQ